jgi:hypothetical protein
MLDKQIALLRRAQVVLGEIPLDQASARSREKMERPGIPLNQAPPP